jgi:tetratricopeptide (TPR) repeat protein
LSLAAAAVLLAAGCKSVDTTAMVLRNQEGNYEMALALGRKALAANPNDAEAHFQMGYAYSQLDSVALAYEHFMKAKELDPKKADNVTDNIQHNYAKHYKLGQSAFSRDDYATAAAEFGMATLSDPMQAPAHYNLAVAYARLAETDSTYHEKALAEADKVLDLSNPSEANYTKALQLAGRQLVELGREQEAVNRFSRLVEEDPGSFAVIEEIGTDLLNAENWKGASVFLKMATEARLKAGAEDFNTYYNLGVAQYRLRAENPAMIDEAIASYEKALAITPDDPSTVFNIQVAFMAKEDWSNAATWGEKYVSVSSADPKGWQYLARCYSELGDKEKAREALAHFEQLRSQQ